MSLKNSEGIEIKSAIASHFSYEICERFAQTSYIKFTLIDRELSQKYFELVLKPQNVGTPREYSNDKIC
ncbi:hypothetical protein LEP1GSC103_1168 [Leptospira borgpetersenii serovar Javanica str. UI 09931]|uniref:Uncharacterized protein n=4 Tax=Leptospira borgpetersenii TaxID=174 RepID=M3H4B3_LEPBO|nr:hypothetical protein C4Q31_13405 [Leptospira borgpetersenii serovar Ceylonica]EKP15093.1 hypothetical protein LEP1GSC128_2230 [Leptospira borgpetersenii str. 200801926]EKQ90420.1 hypothetical protein LEP1GSC101_2058 [Leptospira borgpetersenii str. UI 09149]EMG01929.1 hypothetical protein LEP1GSC123_0353 [Leptospira borgpetersenii str. 200701203]EMN12763.1 hypothetical protein LEP1GSC055_3386 [Leptospira borgpetersenii str. Brem 307]EMN15606.1 hypothetical protein LEP1GSC056_3622 [Leptospira